MTNDVQTQGAVAAALLQRWQADSLASVWRRASDWFTPAAEALAEAIAAGADVTPGCFRLGYARAAAGVGITETIDDLAVLFRAVGMQSPPLRVIRALCEGWTESDAAERVSMAMADPESGLGTLSYLVARLAELYGTTARAGERVSETHALVIVDVAQEGNDPWQRMSRNAAIGHALETAYGVGHPTARLADGLYAVLVERGPDMGAGLAALRDHIVAHATRMGVTTLMRQPPRVWIETLPDSHAYAVGLVESLQR